MVARFSPLQLLAMAGAISFTIAPGAMAQVEEVTPDVEVDATEEVVPQVNIAEIVAGVDEFSTLEAALEAADLTSALAGEGPFTVFAPPNTAFEALPEGVVEALLMPENQDLLTQVLTYHVVPGEVMSTDLEAGMVETLSGEDLTVELGDTVMVDNAQVVAVDVPATNGVVHVIDSVLVPTTVATELQSRMAAMEEEPMMEAAPMVEEATPATPTPAAEPVRGLW